MGGLFKVTIVKRFTALCFVLLIGLRQLWFVLFITASGYPDPKHFSTRVVAVTTFISATGYLLRAVWEKLKGPEPDASIAFEAGTLVLSEFSRAS